MKQEDILGDLGDLEEILKEVAKNPIDKSGTGETTSKTSASSIKRTKNSEEIDDESLDHDQQPPNTPGNYQPIVSPYPALPPASQQPLDNFSETQEDSTQEYFQSYHRYQRGDELSQHELENLLKENLFGFALVILIRRYEVLGEEDAEEAAEARFIRTDVQRFIQQKGRHKFRAIPYALIQEFIDECVASNDVLTDQEYVIEKAEREYYNSQATIDTLVRNANRYHEARAKKDNYENDFGGYEPEH